MSEIKQILMRRDENLKDEAEERIQIAKEELEELLNCGEEVNFLAKAILVASEFEDLYLSAKSNAQRLK